MRVFFLNYLIYDIVYLLIIYLCFFFACIVCFIIFFILCCGDVSDCGASIRAIRVQMLKFGFLVVGVAGYYIFL